MATLPTTLDGTLEQVKHRDRTSQAKKTVRNHSIVNAAIGIVPIPPLGVALIIGNGLKMLHKLSSIYGVKYRKDIGKSIISSFLTGCGSFAISGRLVWGLSTILPAAAPIIGVVTRPVFASALMYAMGQLFIQHFESGGTFLTFDPEKVRGHYAKLFEEGKELAKAE